MMLVLALIGIVFSVTFLLKNKSEKLVEKRGQVEGMVYHRILKRELEGAKVSLGKITSDGTNNNFVVENLTCLTNKDGKFSFDNLDLKEYWVMAEYKGKKVLKKLKLSEDKDYVDDVILKI